MRKVTWAGLGLFALMAPTAGAQTPTQQTQLPRERQAAGITAQVPAPPEALKITYGGQTDTWTVATLAQLPHTTITVYNEHAKENQTYSGVPLIDLLGKLGVPDKPHGKDLRLYVVAEGSDLYEVVYSLGEVTPDVHDGTVLVADSEGGKPLGDDGPLKMVLTGEKRPARWVRNLVAIRVLTAD
jgi:hypothetical protein